MAVTEKFIYDGLGRPHGRKDPDSRLDFTFDWTDWLGTDAIVSIAPAVDVGTATIFSSAHNGKIATVWLTGGTLGEVLQLRCRITTANTPARIEDRTMFLRVASR